MDLLSEKKASDDTYEANVKHYRGLLDQRDKAIQELQSRSLTPSDTDVLRSKLAREIEGQFRQKVESVMQENDKLENEVSPLPVSRNIRSYQRLNVCWH